MEYLLETDFYQVSTLSLISNIDRDVLTDLYQPIIGANAVMLYLNLYQQSKSFGGDEYIVMKYLFNNMSLTDGQIIEARKKLEAVGLVKTFFKEEGDLRYFIFEVYAPKTPKDFFDDVLFNGLLIGNIGEKNALILASKYEVTEADVSGYHEISEPFNTIFHPDYNDRSFFTSLNIKTLGHEYGKAVFTFSKEIFFDYLSDELAINPKSITDEDLKQIERIASLLNLKEEMMAEAVGASYNPNNAKHIDYDDLYTAAKMKMSVPLSQKKQYAHKATSSGVKNNSEIGQLIQQMDTLTPKQFIEELQHGAPVASADIDLINDISERYDLPNGVINALVNYTLRQCDNKLVRSYMEKVAATLKREQIITAHDAMTYLEGSKKKMRYKQSRKAPQKRDEFEEKEVNSSVSEKSNLENSASNDDNLSEEEAELLKQILSKSKR